MKQKTPKIKKRSELTSIEQIMISHNRSIIEDNICFGLCHPADYSENEVKEYQKEAYQEQKEFEEFLKSGGLPVWNQVTEMWQIPHNEA